MCASKAKRKLSYSKKRASNIALSYGAKRRSSDHRRRCVVSSLNRIKSWRFWGWFVVRTLYVGPRERSLYLIRSFILSQFRHLRTGVMWDFAVLVGDSTSKRVLQGGSKKVSCCTVSTAYFFEPPCRCSGVFLSETVEDYDIQWVAVVKFRMNDRNGDGTGSFEVKIRRIQRSSRIW